MKTRDRDPLTKHPTPRIPPPYAGAAFTATPRHRHTRSRPGGDGQDVGFPCVVHRRMEVDHVGRREAPLARGAADGPPPPTHSFACLRNHQAELKILKSNVFFCEKKCVTHEMNGSRYWPLDVLPRQLPPPVFGR